MSKEIKNAYSNRQHFRILNYRESAFNRVQMQTQNSLVFLNIENLRIMNKYLTKSANKISQIMKNSKRSRQQSSISKIKQQDYSQTW